MQTTTKYPLFSIIKTSFFSNDPDKRIMGGHARLTPATIKALYQQFIVPSSMVISFETLDGNSIELLTINVEKNGADGLLWRGRSLLLPGVEATLSVVSDSLTSETWHITGRLFLPDGSRMLLQPDHHGKVNISMMTTPRPEIFARVKPILQSEGEPHESQYTQNYLPLEMNKTPVTIKILPACPESTLHALGINKSSMQSVLGDWQNMTNLIFQNSGIAAQVQMSDLVKLPEPETNDVMKLLRETVAKGGIYTNHKTGSLWDIVHKHRDQTLSDLVLLLAANSSELTVGEAGSIPLPPRYDKANQLEQCTMCLCPKKIEGLDLGQIFAHELGHLMGGMHDTETDMVGGHHNIGIAEQFDYVSGYQSEDRTFTTTMGYPREGETWIPYYSASDRTWLNPKTGQRVATGIPVGKPFAADAAAFFRTSTRTIARYRGGANVSSVSLSLNVFPPLGGTLLPDNWGPYPKGSVQSVSALPRTGYKFDHWELDGQPAGATQPLMLNMNSNRKIKAHFTESTELPLLTTETKGNPDAKISSTALDLDSLTSKKQTGPKYNYGTEVQIDCIVPTLVSGKYKFKGWRVNGNPHLVQGYQYTSNYLHTTNYRLIVRMEKNILVEAIFS